MLLLQRRQLHPHHALHLQQLKPTYTHDKRTRTNAHPCVWCRHTHRSECPCMEGDMMEMSKDYARRFVGQWVHCHSMYGMHVGIVHRALSDGLILVHHTQLASGSNPHPQEFQPGLHQAGDSMDVSQVQFFLPAPGLFVPYAGLFGLWPRPGFFI
jgi:hypothetical protein